MKKVFIGMSGGVDSSYSAYLLKEKGYDVTGVTFSVFDPDSVYQPKSHAMSLEAAKSAEKVCSFLNIPHRVVDLKQEFKENIINYFVESYRKGLTPNPCMMCNRRIKFGLFMKYAFQNDAECFATGHYIRKVEKDGEWFIRKGSDPTKDQAYFLAIIRPENLSRILFPLGNMNKSEVKQQVKAVGLPIDSQRSESQDVCFIDKDYREFLRIMNVPSVSGDMIYNDKKVGRHSGIPFYSLGQRRGLGISVGQRLFIRKFDVNNNQIILGDKPLSSIFSVERLNIFTKHFTSGIYDTQVRYQSKISPAEVNIQDEQAEVILSEPHEIIAPGQFAVFYRDDLIYAGGEITQAQLLDV